MSCENNTPEGVFALRRLVREIKHAAHHLKEKIMSAISDFAAKQNAFEDELDTAVADITNEIKTLNDLVASLQNSAGTVTPADQALLDQIQTRTQGLVAKVKALDTISPPPAPTA